MNQLVIRGSLVKAPRLTRSPAGIPHLLLAIEHRSLQMEAGLTRQCYVRIQAVVSGEEAELWSTKLTLGHEIEVSGFLQRHENAKGVPRLILHAQKLIQV
ncbi:primosomal replication protein N [Aliidiomarina sanyensis]|uniref:Replication restart protein PriB n=1 Tax=Aliidiomarina sanyensis TaxID=1249555 RepID=A0A432WB54_9GAMM|nr:primosomal replication protein N [Aliidiomarina sanyensis]